MKETIRVDAALAELGYFATEEQARRALLAGEVEIDGDRSVKPGWRASIRTTPTGRRLMLAGSEVTVAVRKRCPYVSRGGLKLAAALDEFEIDPAGMTALDIGASTGGFTDCLIQRGAAKVYAVDCGTGQLHAKLRNDSRVVVLERTNARFLTREHVPDVPGAVVIDVSFISLELILPIIHSLCASGALVAALVKPQFEVRPEMVQRGGVVRDAKARQDAVASIRNAMTELGWTVIGEMESPLIGPAGNHEYFLGARI